MFWAVSLGLGRGQPITKKKNLAQMFFEARSSGWACAHPGPNMAPPLLVVI